MCCRYALITEKKRLTKTYLTKYEIMNMRDFKEVQVAVCGMRSIYLNNDTLKTLGTHFSYNEKLKEEKVDCKNFL